MQYSHVVDLLSGDLALSVLHPRRCKTSSVSQSAGLSIPRSLIQFVQKLKNEKSNLHGFELHRPSSKGTQLLFQVIKAKINQWYVGHIVR